VRGLRLAVLVIGLVGVAIAAYLTYVHYAGLKPFCVSGSGGCETVQSSKWAKLGGIPVAVLGLVGYSVIVVSTLVGGEMGKTVGALFAIVGAGFSLWLTYLELFEINAICQWCVASAVLMCLLAVLTTIRLLRYDGPAATPPADLPPRRRATAKS
jgi:uncharacterized membrane protein